MSARQPRVGFQIFLLRLLHHVVGQGRRGRGFVPSRAFRDSRGRIVCRSSAGCGRAAYWSAGQKREESGVSTSSIRMSLPVEQAELEFGVGDDDAAFAGVVARGLVDLQAQRRAPARRCRPRRFARLRSNGMFSSWPVSALVAGVKIGSGNSRGFGQSGGQLDAADGLRFLDIPSSPSRQGSRARRTRWRAVWPFSRSCCGARACGVNWLQIDRAADRWPSRANGSARCSRISRTRNGKSA